MKVITSGFNVYDIVNGDDLKIYDNLPLGVYKVNFEEKKGFSLIKQNDIIVKEKIYGVHNKDVYLIAEGFDKSNRNIGVIFSGEKGLGKSLTANKLCQVMLEEYNTPIIIVDRYYEDLSRFIGQINQSVVVFFDEFDKLFSVEYDSQGSYQIHDKRVKPQEELLTLFDGISFIKKMFLITCNEIVNLSDLLINRTGRFHYHIRFDYPNDKEIKEYVTENANNLSDKDIQKILDFASVVGLNYDSLRSICFELNIGRKFEDVINILNIINLEDKDYYKFNFEFSNGLKFTTVDNINLFDDDLDVVQLDVYIDRLRVRGYIFIDRKDLEYDWNINKWICKHPENIQLEISFRDEYNNLKCTSLVVERKKNLTYHFNKFAYSR